jgi:hypothetical protein
MRLEPLEDRKMLALTAYVNDNWVNVTDPGNPVQINDVVVNSLDSINPGGIIATYGVDAFGTVDGTSVASAKLIYDAIQALDAGGDLNILEGTYQESDIVIDRPMTLTGAGTGNTLIVPEVTSSGSLSDFGVGTHSGIIIYSPSVTVQGLRLNGNGNGSLAGSLNYHQGITTLYNTQNGGDYSSLHNGSLPLIMLGSPYRGNPNETVPALHIADVAVDNTFWHGITISALADKAFDSGSGSVHAEQVVNSTVNNVGDVKDANRIGILLQNINDTQTGWIGNAQGTTVSNVGIGIKTAAFGSSPDFENRNAAHNGSQLALNTVNNAVLRAYDVDFAFRTGHIGNVANFTAGNNAVGLYVNHSRTIMTGFEVNGAKIGVHVQNSLFSNEIRPVLAYGSVLTGPGTGVAGSIGVLIDNDGSQQNSASALLAAGSTITGYATAVQVVQNVAPADSLDNVLILDRPTITGNAAGIIIGNGGQLGGAMANGPAVTVTGTGEINPRFFNDPVDPYYYNSPGNSATPVVTPPKASVQGSGNLSLSSSSTFAPYLTGETGSATLFNFNSFANYPFATPPENPVNGIIASPYGALFNWFGNVTQDGSGQLVVGNAATNGYGYDFLFGSNNTPIGENQYQLNPTDISGRTNLDIAIKLAPGNQADVIGFGLFDLRGNANEWTIPADALNTSAYTTVSINLLAPSIDLTGPDSHLDLTKIVGYVIGGDQGTANGAQDIPIAFVVDDASVSSVAASRLDVTGTVNLGGASLVGSLKSGFLGGTAGTQYTIINNDGADAVVGTFAGLAQGATVNIGGKNFTISYIGGTGNDVVLTRSSDSAVFGRRVFYNQSKFDGNTTGISASDDLAIATDKSAYLPGTGAATFSNITSYTRGINGIMVDFPGAAGTLTVADFTFKMSLQTGANNTPSTWAAAPAPVSFSVRAGAGVSGSDRVEIIWANGAIANRWLEVIVEGNDAVGGFNTNTGLSASDIFFFGNRIGDNGTGTATLAITSATDELAARNNPGAGATITNLVDYDRSGIVSAVDSIAARNNSGTLTKINLTNPPAAPEGDGDAAVATALAIPGLPSIPGVPAWIARRLDSIDLDSGPVARFLEHLADVGSPGTIKILEKIHDAAHELGLEHDLLDDLLEGLG